MKTQIQTQACNSHWRFKRSIMVCITLLYIIFDSHLYAQSTVTINGFVKDDKGEPLVGANVMMVGNQSKGTITDINGAFTLKVPEESIVRISFVGFTPKIAKVTSKTRFLAIVLEEAVLSKSEIVVTALGISREAKSLSYGRQSVDVGTMTEARDGNLLNMMAGKVSGVQFISNGGPTSSTRVVIRGNNSLTGNNQPLYVIDGIPIMNEMGDANGGDIDYGNAAAKINPDDVENIEVLKGANAAALYGSDAANGVILITTRKATRKNGFGVTVSSNLMFNTLTEYPDYQNVYGSGANSRLWTGYNTYATTGSNYNPNLAWGLADLSNFSYNNRSLGLPMLGFDVVGKNGIIKSYSPNPDNISNMYRTGSTFTKSVSLDKITDLSSFRFSYTNTNGDDVLKNFNVRNKHAFSLSTTHKITDKISTAFNVKYNFEKTTNRGYRNSSNRNPLYVITQMPRDLDMTELSPWKRPNGTSIQFNGFTNPYWLLNELSNEDERNWVMSDLTLNLKLSKTVDLRLRGATDQQYSNGWDFTNFYTPFDPDGSFSNFTQQTRNDVFDGLISYKKKFKKISVNANVGALAQSMLSKRENQSASVLFQSDIKSISNNGGTFDARELYSAKKKQAVFGLLSTGFKDFAYMDVTLRNDWSSTLPLNNNSYFYYSLGGSFILTEAFKLPKSIFSFAKLRTSYATVGNDAQFDQLSNGYAYGGLYLGMPWYASETLKKNPNLKPERTRSREIGADLRLFNSRVNMDITYYSKSTIDQINSANISSVSGYSKMMCNSGEIMNSGTEIALTLIPIKTSNVVWTSNINWSNNRSKVVSLVEGVDRFLLNSWNGTTVQIYAEVGKPYGVMYGNDWKKDAEGHILVDATGRTIQVSDNYIGKVEPDWIGGWRNTLKYKDFDLSILFDFKKGGLFWSYSDYEATRDGQNIKSLQGRDEFMFSSWILGETDNERNGNLDLSSTVNPAANLTNNGVNYYDDGRIKGINIPNRYYDASVPGLAGQPCNTNVKPYNYFTDDCLKNIRFNTYDASYLKLREISIGYSLPASLLKKSLIKSAKISAVGRNLAILYRNTPKGIDPEATSTTGNGQGLEFGFSLPSATYGFDLKISF